MHTCAQVKDVMTTLTWLAHRTSKKHEELTSAQKIDLVDITRLFDWISKHNPFDPSQPKLRSVPSGLAASVVLESIAKSICHHTQKNFYTFWRAHEKEFLNCVVLFNWKNV